MPAARMGQRAAAPALLLLLLLLLLGGPGAARAQSEALCSLLTAAGAAAEATAEGVGAEAAVVGDVVAEAEARLGPLLTTATGRLANLTGWDLGPDNLRALAVGVFVSSVESDRAFVRCGGNLDAVATVVRRALEQGAFDAARRWQRYLSGEAAATNRTAAEASQQRLRAFNAFVSPLLRSNANIDFVSQLDWYCFLFDPMTGEPTGVTGLLETLLECTPLVPERLVPVLGNMPNLLATYFAIPGCTAEELLAWLDAIFDALAEGELSASSLSIPALFQITGSTRSGRRISLSQGDPNMLRCIGVANLIPFVALVSGAG